MGLLDVQENHFASMIRTSLKEAETSPSLNVEEKTAVALAADEIERCHMATCSGFEDLETALGQFWSTGLHPRESQDRSTAELLEAAEEAEISPMLDLSWTIGMSDDFLKSIGSVDKKTQGRIREAISKLSRAPNKAVGNTVKPLTGNLAGLWRYRIGDYRLIYQPDTNSNCVVLIRFTPRGEAYD